MPFCSWSVIRRRASRRRCARAAASSPCALGAALNVAAAVAAATGTAADAAQGAAAAADGSVARALAFLDEDALELRRHALDLLDRLPALDSKALHALGEALAEPTRSRSPPLSTPSMSGCRNG